MSVEFFLYSDRSEVLERPVLAERLALDGWDVLFAPAWPKVELVDQGGCGDDLIIGCKSASDHLSPIRDLFQKKDAGGIEKLLSQPEYANCALEIESPFDFGDTYDEDDVEDLIADLGSESVDAMKRAATMYSVRIHGMQNALSGELQMAVWKSLGALCGGLMEDPQTGEATLLRAETSS